MFDQVFLNEYGFYSLKQIPSEQERRDYYENRYHRPAKEGQAPPPEALRLNREVKLTQKLMLINEHTPPANERSFLDIGCGKGFALAFFKQKGFDVLGLDYGDTGVKSYNQEVLANLTVGDANVSLARLAAEGKTFDVINMDDFLEHIPDPKSLLDQVYKLLADAGAVVIKVPNDFSVLQRYFVENGVVSGPSWVAPLDHISYFNKEGLIRLCEKAGLRCADLLGNRLIEISALNPDTNYFQDKKAGRASHLADIAFDNILHGISPEKSLALYRAFGDMGIGREIIGVFKKIE